MKFQLLVYVAEEEIDYGEMTSSEIKDFVDLIVEHGTDDGYMFDELKFSIGDKTFFLFLA